MKKITVVYQDCVLCGDRGEKKRQFLGKRGLEIRKVSAFSDEGQELVNRAVFEHKITGLPFYTDGNIFSYHPSTFFRKKKVRKSHKKSEVKREKSGSAI